VGSVEAYLARGPGFLFLFHPALGPLWDVVAQKLRGGALAPGAELVLEARPRARRRERRRRQVHSQGFLGRAAPPVRRTARRRCRQDRQDAWRCNSSPRVRP